MLKWISPLVALSVVACTVGPDYRRPELDLPAQWNNEVLLSAQERENLTGGPSAPACSRV